MICSRATVKTPKPKRLSPGVYTAPAGETTISLVLAPSAKTSSSEPPAAGNSDAAGALWLEESDDPSSSPHPAANTSRRTTIDETGSDEITEEVEATGRAKLVRAGGYEPSPGGVFGVAAESDDDLLAVGQLEVSEVFRGLAVDPHAHPFFAARLVGTEREGVNSTPQTSTNWPRVEPVPASLWIVPVVSCVCNPAISSGGWVG